MSSTETFKFILVLLVAILALELIARRLRLPTAASLLAGGIAIAFLPGIPPVSFDPELVLIVFLPPLLQDGAFYTVWSDFRRYLGGILWLAVGAVIFTTFVVGAVAHWVLPSLPWAACFALGAVVSPPDAVAAKAVLGKVRLPRRLMVLLEGESLLNDATGLVLFRFAVAAALTGAFSLRDAVLSFAGLALGGIAVGALVGYVLLQVLRRIDHHVFLAITAACLSPWAAYIGGESLHVSGVMATVTCGILFGWYQHDVFSAHVRVRATAFWQVMIFLLEALVFILIGFSLRGVVERLGGLESALHTLGMPLLAVVTTVVLSRFAWVYATDYLRVPVERLFGRRPSPPSPRASFLLGWAGMRGVVTLAIALSLPESMPGRDLTLAAAFATILVTVVVQGGTMGPVIRWLGLDRLRDESTHLNEGQAQALIDAAQLAAVRRLAYAADGSLIHPRLLEQYTYRTTVAEQYAQAPRDFSGGREAHYDVVLAAIAAGRVELLRLHRSGQIHDELLHYIELDLDLQQISAENDRSAPES